MLLKILFRYWQCCIVCHGLYVLLRCHGSTFFNETPQQFEVIDVESRRVRIKELSLSVEWIGEGMRRSDWDAHKIAHFSIDVWFTRNVEANSSLGSKKHFIMHLMPKMSRFTRQRQFIQIQLLSAVLSEAFDH